MNNKFLVSVRKLSQDELTDAMIMMMGFRSEVVGDKILASHFDKFFKGVDLKPDMQRHEQDEAVAQFIENYLNYFKFLSNKKAEVTGNPRYIVDEDYVERRALEYSKYGVVEALRKELGLKQIVVKGEVMPPENKVEMFKSYIRGTDTGTMYAPLTNEQDIWLIRHFNDKNIYSKAYTRYRNPDTGAIQKDVVFAANFMAALHKAQMDIIISAFGFYGPKEIIAAYHARASRGGSKDDKLITSMFGTTYDPSQEYKILEFLMQGMTPDQVELIQEYWDKATGKIDEPVEEFEEVEGIDVFEPQPKLSRAEKRRLEREATKKPVVYNKSSGPNRSQRRQAARARRRR